MSESQSDDDWFNQDEEELVQGLEQKVRCQEQGENEERIKYQEGDILNRLNVQTAPRDTNGLFSKIDFTKALKMEPISMFLFFFSEEKDLFANQLVGIDSLERFSLYLQVLRSLCQLELGGFDELFLQAFAKQSVLIERVRLLILALNAKPTDWQGDEESNLVLKNMMWLMVRAHKLGALGPDCYELLELYRKLNDHLKLNFREELETFNGTTSRNMKLEIYAILDQLLGNKTSNEIEEEERGHDATNNVSKYLKKQRQLLQKDFFLPLREFVQHLRANQDIEKLQEQGLLWSDTFLSLNPEFNEAKRHSLVYLNLQNSTGSKKNKQKVLEGTKTGALLCLTTSIEFDNLILASVGYTEPEVLDQKCLSVEIVRQFNIGNIYGQKLIMFQTPVFFEPYLRVHNYLSTCSADQLPMRRYILDGEFDIRPPAYIKPEAKLIHNDLPLNESQRQAFKDAFSREFSIIQGPPGTGKTHLSVELVKSLIQNAKATGTGPIIVLSYTNDSLDKFLVKISRYTDNVLRFGSQSRDPQIAKFNARGKANVHPRLKHIWWRVNCEYKEKFQNLQSLYANFDGSGECYQDALLAQQEVQQVADRLETLRTVFRYFEAINMDIVAMTTTCAARFNFLFRLLKSKCVVLEEAAEIPEAHILACLTPETEHVILVGDHKQLQPFSGSGQVQQISLFERLIVAGMPFSYLNLQYRMRPCIAALLVPTIYEALLCSDSVNEYADVRLMGKNLFFLNHNHPEHQLLDTSFVNSHEARILVDLTMFLIEKAEYQHRDIVILSPYNAQLDCIKALLPKKYREGVQVCSVDSFQGLEANIVLLSLVRSNPDGQIGFLRQPNRVCVALSRARWALYIIGNINALLKGNPRLWGAIARRLEETNATGWGYFPTQPDNKNALLH